MEKTKKKAPTKATVALPTTYKRLFALTYKTNLNLIFKLSLIVFLFALPFIVSVILKGLFEASILHNEALNEEEMTISLLRFRSYYGFIISTCFLFVGIGLAGCFYVAKQYLTNEGMLFKRDFKKGIKKNWKGFLLLTALFAYFGALLNFVLNYLYVTSYYGIFFILFVILSIILFCVYLISLNVYQNYTVPFFKLLKNSYLIFFSQLPCAFLFLLCSVGPLVVVYFINVGLVQYIAWLVYICLGFGHSVIVIVIFNLYILDETVNKKQFKEAYRKGLFDGEHLEIVDEGFSNGSED